MSAIEIIFPRVDMDMKTGRIGKWLAAEGAVVAKGEPLFEIETDKAAMEIEAPASGVLRGLVAAGGDEINVGAPVAWIVPEGSEWQESATTPRREPAIAAPLDAPPAASMTPVVAPVTPAAPAAAMAEAGLVRATPLARREAARRGIDLGAVGGSGPRGRIVCADLDRLARPATAPLPASKSGVLPRQWLGPAQGTPLVFLHGFGAEQSGWRPVWSALEAGHRILGIDLPGHGRSPAIGGAGFASLVEAVQDVLRAEGVERLHLVGHSLGGGVALGLAEAGGLDLRSLGLIAPTGLGAEIDGEFLAGFTRARRAEGLAPWLRRLFADPSWVTPGFVRATLQGRAQDALRDHQAAIADRLFPDGTQATDLRAALDRLRRPVKVIWGRRDAIIPARHAAGLPGMVAVHTVADAGHMPHIEAPQLVAELLAQLCRSAA